MRKKHPPKPAPRPVGPLLLIICAIAGISGWFYWHNRSPRPESPTLEPNQRNIQKKALSQYGGSQSCRGCHAEIFEEFKTSHHALAERPISAELDARFFDRKVTHGTQTSDLRHTGTNFQIVTAN